MAQPLIYASDTCTPPTGSDLGEGLSATADSAQRHGTPPTRQYLQVSRTAVWAGAVAVGIALLALGHPLVLALLCLALSSMAAASIAAPSGSHGTGIVGALPAGFVLVCAWALLWGLGGGVLGVGVWSGRVNSLQGVAAFAVLTGVAVRRRGGSVTLVGRDATGLSGFLVLTGFFVWVIASQPLGLWSRISGSGTDFLRHLGSIRVASEAGMLVPAEPGYPKALYALAAWPIGGMGIPLQADALWRAVAPMVFLLLGLMLLALMIAATRVTDSLVGGAVPGVAAAGLACIVFVQTAWFTSFLAFGSVMNMLVALCLLSLLTLGLQPSIFGSTSGSVVAASAVAVTANSWQLLLPVAGVASLPWFVQFLRRGRRRPADWLAWALGGALTVNGLLGLRKLDGIGHSATPTVSNLFRPEWWWAVAIVLALVAAVLGLRNGLRSWAVMSVGMLSSSVGLIAFLMWMTGSTWDLMLYYPVKATWNAMVLVIPLACAGGVAVLVRSWRSAAGSSGVTRSAVRGGLALVIGVAIAGFLGRSFAFPPHLLPIAQGRAGIPNWSLALLDAMESVSVPDESREGALVFGLVPSADASGVTGGFVGMVDYMAMEALDHAGIEGAFGAPVKVGLYNRDMTQVCRYLMDHPASLRLSGPNPGAGAQWIIGSGCPEAVVQPERWINLDIDPMWLERSPWEDGQWSFPTFGDVQQSSIKG